MELFHKNGHLTDDALDALLRGDVLPELSRLEISEHLSYCDDCLSRYTALLADETLLTPAVSCQKSLWQRIRLRTLRIVTSRYATAAAGIALMVAVLWGSAGFSRIAIPELPEALPTLSQQLQNWPEQLGGSLSGVFAQVTAFFEQTSGRGTASRGGSHS